MKRKRKLDMGMILGYTFSVFIILAVLTSSSTVAAAKNNSIRECKLEMKKNRDRPAIRAYMQVAKQCGGYDMCRNKVLSSDGTLMRCRTACLPFTGGENMSCLRKCLTTGKKSTASNKKVDEMCGHYLDNSKCEQKMDQLEMLLLTGPHAIEYTNKCGFLLSTTK